jgi:hypothetical protein
VEEITLNYKQSVVTFDFQSLNFTNSHKNQYAYIMEGFDKEWTFAGNRRTATYTNLNQGKYVFKVKASNNDGVWNEEPHIVAGDYSATSLENVACFFALCCDPFCRCFCICATCPGKAKS